MIMPVPVLNIGIMVSDARHMSRRQAYGLRGA